MGGDAKPGMRQKIFGEVRENARRDAVCKMRTDARHKSISGTHTQLCIYVLKMEFYTKNLKQKKLQCIFNYKPDFFVNPLQPAKFFFEF